MKAKSWLWLLLLPLSLIFWFGCISTPLAIHTNADAQILHVLNRLSFGPRPGDIEHVKDIGIENYIQEQLSPASLSEPSQLKQILGELPTLKATPIELFREYGPLRRRARQLSSLPEQKQRQMRKRRRETLREAIQARLIRATLSPRQLQEVMVEFWFNHFNVFAGKGLTRIWVGTYEEQAIRPHVLGKFRELLEATARHPAMLFYLDNWRNTAPESSGARGRFKGLNENYARELMELHTLGVDGGYTQDDVIALARIFTGWGLARPHRLGDGSGFLFDERRHDYGDKVFLGTLISGSGRDEVEQALDILVRHPSTATHISYKLAQYFVADEPPPGLVDRLAQRFQETDGDIRAVLTSLFSSDEFWQSQYMGNKFKTPYQYIISILRAVDSSSPNLVAIAGLLRQLNMLPYLCPTPDGYANTQETWLNPDTMLRRISIATAMAQGRWSGKSRINPEQLRQTLGNPFSEQSEEAIASSPQQIQAALMLGSPEMMYR